MLKEMTGEGCTIEDTGLLRRLRQKSAGALEEAVRQYGAYVMAIIRNRSRGVLTAEDQEEIASDVFVSLWRGAKSISRGQLRPWLGAVARNQTADAMRRKRVYVPLEDDTLISLEPLWERMYESQRCEAIRSALLALSDFLPVLRSGADGRADCGGDADECVDRAFAADAGKGNTSKRAY